MSTRKRFKDFVTFCGAQIEYGYTDQHVAFFAALADKLDLDREQRIWLGLVFMAYYHEGSAWAAYTLPSVQSREAMPPLDYPIGMYRRNLFGGRIKKHFKWLMEKDSFSDWLDVKHWSDLLEKLHEPYGNGHWAAYTSAGMLVKMKGLHRSIQPDTFGVMETPGTAHGLKCLNIEPSEKNAMKLMETLSKLGFPMSLEIFESVLCNWGALNNGTFYPGSNLDRQQGRITQIEKITGRKFPELWYIRKKTFNNKCLGELNGWSGKFGERKKAYVKTGRVLMPDDDRG